MSVCASVFTQQQTRSSERRRGSVSDQKGSRHHVCDAEQPTQEPGDDPSRVGQRGHEGQTPAPEEGWSGKELIWLLEMCRDTVYAAVRE